MPWITLETLHRPRLAAAALVCASLVCASLVWGEAMAQTAPSLEDPLAALQRELAQTPNETPAAAANQAGADSEITPQITSGAAVSFAAPIDAPAPRRTLEPLQETPLSAPSDARAPLAGLAAQTRVWAAAAGVPNLTLTFALAMIAALGLGALAAAVTRRAPAAARPNTSRRSAPWTPESDARPRAAGPNLERLKQSIRDEWPRAGASQSSAPHADSLQSEIAQTQAPSSSPAPSARDVLAQAADRSVNFETPPAAAPRRDPAPTDPMEETSARDAFDPAMFDSLPQTGAQPGEPSPTAAQGSDDPLSSALQRLSELKRRAKSQAAAPTAPPPDAPSEDEAFDAVMRLLMEDDAVSPAPSADLDAAAEASDSAAAVLRRAQSGSARAPAE